MADDSDNSNKFEFHDHSGWLFVSLERPRFERVFKAVQENAGISDITELHPAEVSEILIRDESRQQATSPQSIWWKDRLFLIGCGILTFVIVFVLVMGVLAIWGIVSLPR